MNIVLPKKDLIPLIDRAVQVADKKSAVPALANALLVADKGHLRVSGTDLYRAMTGDVACEVATPGSIAVPAKDLLERVKAMPEGPIQISVDASCQALIKAVGQARRYTIHGLPGVDFPTLPEPKDGAVSFELPTSALATLMARTHFSISTDETRAHVNSAFFEGLGHAIHMVSTDGHRLSKQALTHTAPRFSMLIPQKAIGDLRRLVDGAKDETVLIQVCNPNAFFTLAGVRFSVKLVEAQFPPYNQVIPAVLPPVVRVPRIPLMDALKAIRLSANDKTGGVKLAFVPGALRITGESADTGSAFDEISTDYTGAEMWLGMNAQYALDALGALDCDEVRLGVSGELNPMIVQAGNYDDFTGVLMPMRIA